MKKFTDKTQLILDQVQAGEQAIAMQANRYHQAQGAKVGNACNRLNGSKKLYDQCVYDETYKKKDRGISEQRATAEDVRGIKDTSGLIAFFKSLMKKKDDDEENGVNENYDQLDEGPGKVIKDFFVNLFKKPKNPLPDADNIPDEIPGVDSGVLARIGGTTVTPKTVTPKTVTPKTDAPKKPKTDDADEFENDATIRAKKVLARARAGDDLKRAVSGFDPAATDDRSFAQTILPKILGGRPNPGWQMSSTKRAEAASRLIQNRETGLLTPGQSKRFKLISPESGPTYRGLRKTGKIGLGTAAGADIGTSILDLRDTSLGKDGRDIFDTRVPAIPRTAARLAATGFDYVTNNNIATTALNDLSNVARDIVLGNVPKEWGGYTNADKKMIRGMQTPPATTPAPKNNKKN